ncbi:MAG: CBS domain-containing protein [Myxococcota bacterium]
MRCEEIMKAGVQCCRPEDTVMDAAVRMRDNNVGFLPICDEDGKVKGVVTDRDIVLRCVAEDLPYDTRVEDCMSSDEIVFCRPQDDLKRAQQLMGAKQKSRILVCDDSGRLVGVISLSDIAQFEDGSTAANTMRRVSERETRTH